MRSPALAALQYATVVSVSDPVLSERSGTIELELNRIGLDGNGNFEVTLGPASAAALSGGSANIQIEAGNTRRISLPYQLAANLQPGEAISFEVLVSAENGSQFSTVINFAFGPTSPLIQQEDVADDTKWNKIGWKYNLVPGEGYSWTDNPNGNPSGRRNLDYIEPIDLRDALTAQLQFEARWELENGFDYVQVEVSTSGQGWQPLCGRYTVLGNGKQSPYQPLYTGSQSNWVEEVISLEEFAGEQLWIRFVSYSDLGNSLEGFRFRKLTLEKVDPLASSETPKRISTVFPNPSSGIVHISTTGLEQITWQLFDYTGKLLQSGLNSKSNLTLDLSAFANGVYQLQLSDQAGFTETRKVLLQR